MQVACCWPSPHYARPRCLPCVALDDGLSGEPGKRGVLARCPQGRPARCAFLHDFFSFCHHMLTC
eukprot:6212596-Pleurochrysis_carterae.AAC.9